MKSITWTERWSFWWSTHEIQKKYVKNGKYYGIKGRVAHRLHVANVHHVDEINQQTILSPSGVGAPSTSRIKKWMGNSKRWNIVTLDRWSSNFIKHAIFDDMHEWCSIASMSCFLCSDGGCRCCSMFIIYCDINVHFNNALRMAVLSSLAVVTLLRRIDQTYILLLCSVPCANAGNKFWVCLLHHWFHSPDMINVLFQKRRRRWVAKSYMLARYEK